MELVYTVDDPNAFTKPWNGVRLFAWTPDSRSLEYICEENNRNVPDENGLVYRTAFRTTMQPRTMPSSRQPRSC